MLLAPEFLDVAAPSYWNNELAFQITRPLLRFGTDLMQTLDTKYQGENKPRK
jgi:hypothetical protein